MNNLPPFCVDCVNHSLWADGFDPKLSSSHGCSIVALSVVTGLETNGKIKCETNRASDGICGPDGKFFEAMN